MMPDLWCCPMCGHVNDRSLGVGPARGYCQGNRCADVRGIIRRSGMSSVPEMWMALSMVSRKEWGLA